jgi:hypothetical protein
MRLPGTCKTASGIRGKFRKRITPKSGSGQAIGHCAAFWKLEQWVWTVITMSEQSSLDASVKLRAIKAAHTAIWAFFATCVCSIPVAAWLGHLRLAACLGAFVLVEVLVLLLNAWSCPLTAIAARYTSDRAANFDIYLPEWLARHNKLIFGSVYVAGVAFTLVQWARLTGWP